MDCLLAFYTQNFDSFDGSVFDIFTKFYETDLTPIYSWLEKQFSNKISKNDNISALHRREGNIFFVKKDLEKSLEFYTKSLCFAIPNSKEYGLALANRSAVSYQLQSYLNCLRDIELCFKTDYPSELRPKILIRKAECYLELGLKEALDKCIKEIESLLECEKMVDKNKFRDKIKQLRHSKSKHCGSEGLIESSNEIPKFPLGENKSFACASSKIRVSYSKAKGRHVIAATQIHRGDLLFIEKAFSFAPVFKETKELHPFKCYYCLNDVLNGLPCESCTVCVYCDEKCRDESWSKCHKWECPGMQANIWYELGIVFPALKTMLKGCEAGFCNNESTVEDDLKCFGDKKDNYVYFNRLLSNIYKNKNVLPYVVMAAIVVSYLKKYTDFFSWYLHQPQCPKKDLNCLIGYIGGMVAKHIAQLACNSSTIEHWKLSLDHSLFPDSPITVATGVFPSVSLMNHSCKTNVTNYYVCDTIVVKALEDIAQEDEVLNSYGIDYRTMSREQRQYTLKKLYHFECKCVICSDPSKEFDMLNGYSCPKCDNLIPDSPKYVTGICTGCREQFHLGQFRKTNKLAGQYYQNVDTIEHLFKSLRIREKTLYQHHRDFGEIYFKLYSAFVETGDGENMFKYFQLWLENAKVHRGANSRMIGTTLYEAALEILHCLQTSQFKSPNLKSWLPQVEHMIREAKAILNLYYPDNTIEILNKKIQLITKK